MTPLETIIRRLAGAQLGPGWESWNSAMVEAARIVREELSKPLTDDQLQQLGKALYEIEPFMVSDLPMPWEKLEPETRTKCVKYANVMMAVWQKIGGGA